MLVLEACSSGGQGCNRHSAPAIIGLQLLQQVGTPDGHSAANPRHPVNFREGTQDDYVLIGLDEIEDGSAITKMDVGFVDEYNRAFRLRGEQLIDVGVRGHRSGGIV